MKVTEQTKTHITIRMTIREAELLEGALFDFWDLTAPHPSIWKDVRRAALAFMVIVREKVTK